MLEKTNNKKDIIINGVKNILVTGASGFIGSNFVFKQLNETSNQIINFDNLTYAGDISKFDSIKDNNNYKFIRGNVCNRDNVAKAFSKFQPDAVIHFAAESHVDRSIEGPADFIQTNIVGTSVLLEESLKYYKKLDEFKKKNFRFLHISTDEVFGELGDKGKFTEKTPYNPSSPYSASKASSDHLVRAWHRTFGLPVLITNCSNNYGPYQFPEKLIPLMIINAISNKKLPVYGKGENIRDWLYVEDHCDAIYTVLQKGKIGETYNIGGNCEKTNLEIVENICNNLDDIKPSSDGKSYKEQITFVKDRPGHDYRYAMDISKINQELHWKPKESFESGIRKTIEWYLSNHDWVERIISGEYREWIEKNYGERG
ncbi:MAG: dTDP-glucose 4,6-dehydratase [Candidatus Cloacimonetes bacterium]|nr:dTDP-glucose 4,6-dehydratase [Candidatus Cloacimonadota bacterium]